MLKMTDRNWTYQNGRVSTHYNVQCKSANRQTFFSGRGNARIKPLFSGHIANKFRRPTILQLNIEGLTADKMNVLHHLAMQSEALVILLQETHCIDAEKLVLPNYQLAGSSLSRKHGLATFVHERLRYMLLDQSPPTSDIEWLCVDVDGYIIVNVYKPPPTRLQIGNWKDLEGTLSQDMFTFSAYLLTWRLKLSHTKTVTAAFHLNNREAKRELKVYNNGRLLPLYPTPTYLGIKLDRSLTFRHHLVALRKKLSSRVTLLRRLVGSGLGAGAKTLRIATLSLVYSTAEYCGPVAYAEICEGWGFVGENTIALSSPGNGQKLSKLDLHSKIKCFGFKNIL